MTTCSATTRQSRNLASEQMSGFDNAKVVAAAFAGTTVKSNFPCNLGHGDPTKFHQRSPCLSFEEVCQMT